MGYDQNRFNTGLLTLRVESGALVAPVKVAARIENFAATPEGTLQAVRGPLPLVPSYGEGLPALGNPHGIFHALLMNGSRDVTLLHAGNKIYVLDGFTRSWRVLIGPSGSGAQYIAELVDNLQPQYPTQFESTPTGIVIVPQNRSRAFFYDGEVVLPLGYDRIPDPPTGYGPYSHIGKAAAADLPNYYGYTGNGVGTFAIRFSPYNDFGQGQVGTVLPDATGVQSGVIASSTYQAAVQFIDYFGNLSPLSPRSNTVTIDTENVPLPRAPETYMHAFLWACIPRGPEGTIGRILCHTKDMKNAGTTDLFEVPGNMLGSNSGSFATMPDNSVRQFHYNRPDSTLITRPPEPIPVPTFKLCRMAFGRMWIAGIEGDAAAVIPSMPGRWGTFTNEFLYYPDPRGSEITGMWTISEGLLVFTLTSTFLVMPTDDGKGFKVLTLSSTAGCAAPSSICSLPDGTTIWLGREGFYRFSGEGGVQLISQDIDRDAKRINPARARQACAYIDMRSQEYRCWVPLAAGRVNDLCFVFDPINEGWRRRRGVEYPAAVCSTRDHRSYGLMAASVIETGGFSRNGGWLIDHEAISFEPENRTARLETAWIEGMRSKDVKSGKLVYLWLRESFNGSLTVEVYRDWRETTVVYTDTKNGAMMDPEDIPALWGTTVYGQTTKPNQWVKRRPFWKKVSIWVPSCEVYKIVISTTSPCELLGLSMDELPHGGSGRVP